MLIIPRSPCRQRCNVIGLLGIKSSQSCHHQAKKQKETNAVKLDTTEYDSGIFLQMSPPQNLKISGQIFLNKEKVVCFDEI